MGLFYFLSYLYTGSGQGASLEFFKCFIIKYFVFRKAQNLRKLKNVERRRITSPTISEVDDYSSAVDMDSSDLEFYDLSDEETISTVTPIEQVGRMRFYCFNFILVILGVERY